MALDNRTIAVAALLEASKTGADSAQYFCAVANVRATLWLGELIADLTSAIRETGHRQ